MLKQKRIDQYYKVIHSKRTQNNVKQNFELQTVSQNVKKRKSVKQHISASKKNVKVTATQKCTIKHSKINGSYLDDDTDIQEVFQNNNILNNEELYLNVKKDVLSSQISEVTSESITMCERVNETELSDFLELELLFQDDNISPESNELMHKNENHRVSSINKLQNSCVDNITLSNNSNINLIDKEKSPIIKSNTSTPKKSKYSPRTSYNKSPKKMKCQRLIDRFMDTDIINKVIENMNLAKQGVIASNNFNLEDIYSKNTFKYCYSQSNIKDSVKYELSRINLSVDLYATILVGSILTVLSNPLNCGYFDGDELDFIYSILTLPEKAQMLLARMIKRKRGWHRKSDINYSEISTNLKDTFDLLESQFICTFDVKNYGFRDALSLLHINELCQICRSMKIDPKGKKEILIDKLLKLSNKKSLFPGMKNPSNSLYNCIFNALEYCVRITDKTWYIIDIIMTLLLPNEDPEMGIDDIYHKLGDIYLGKIIYPYTFRNTFPIFSCRVHLLSYVHVKSMLSTTLKLIEKKNWENVQSKGNFAMEMLPEVLKDEYLRLKNSMIPMHVRRFMPGYIWLKILSKSVDAFKRSQNMARAVEILNLLLEQKCHMHTRKGKWYNELALIKMFHQKNVESSALVVIEALETEYLSQVDILELIKRANKILKKKKGITSDIKMSISKMVDNHICQMPTFTTSSNIIYASKQPSVKGVPGSKSIWCIKNNNIGQSYGSVEALVLHYYTEQNFSKGLHCEGNLPILLFAILFWEELYDKHIPGTFMSPYENAPADLFTEYFYTNRKDIINKKLDILNTFNAESLSCQMEKKFKLYYQYQSLIPKNLLQQSEHMKEIVYCLGVQGVIGICKRMIDNFNLWKAGFPDLIVWNYDTRQHKIIEVKGPNDVLSTKQQLWLEYLNKLGLNTEVCQVQDEKSVQC